MEVQIFLQARMGSRRFPGKVLADIAGKSVLERTIKRLQQVTRASKIVLVTSERQDSDQVAKEAERLNIPVFRGAEENTLDRLYQAAGKFQPDVIVRVTADCPLIDPKLIDQGIRLFQEKNVEFVGDARPFTYPHGLQFEVIKREALERAWNMERKRFASELAFKQARLNTSSRIVQDPSFQKAYMTHKPNLAHIRITLDYPEDLELIRKVYDLLAEEKLDFPHIVELFEKRPELLRINEKFVKLDYGINTGQNRE